MPFRDKFATGAAPRSNGLLPEFSLLTCILAPPKPAQVCHPR